MHQISLRTLGLLSLMIASVFTGLGVNAQTSAAPTTNRHPVPQIPVKIDGVKHEAQAITRFDGRPLYSVIDANSEREGVVYVFTTEQQFDAYLRGQGHVGRAELAKVLATPLRHTDYNDNRSIFYEDINYDIPTMGVTLGSSAYDLSDYQLAWYGGSWNDAISSVKANPAGRGTYLYEHRAYGGSYLFIAATVDIPDLRTRGWNDRASSIKVLN